VVDGLVLGDDDLDAGDERARGGLEGDDDGVAGRECGDEEGDLRG
jgi:hypothetical protein